MKKGVLQIFEIETRQFNFLTLFQSRSQYHSLRDLKRLINCTIPGSDAWRGWRRSNSPWSRTASRITVPDRRWSRSSRNWRCRAVGRLWPGRNFSRGRQFLPPSSCSRAAFSWKGRSWDRSIFVFLLELEIKQKKKNWEILGKWELGAIGKGGLKEDYKIVI